MKSEEQYDLYKWKASQPLSIFRVLLKTGDTHEVLAHDAAVEPSTPVLKLIAYKQALLPKIETIGGSKNKKVEETEEEMTVPEMVAAYLPGEYVSVVKVDSLESVGRWAELVASD